MRQNWRPHSVNLATSSRTINTPSADIPKALATHSAELTTS
jgi:hypothetical protein